MSQLATFSPTARDFGWLYKANQFTIFEGHASQFMLELGRQAHPSPRALVPADPSNVLFLFHISLLSIPFYTCLCLQGIRYADTPIPYHFCTYILCFSSSSPQSFAVSNTEVSPFISYHYFFYLLYLAVILRYYKLSVVCRIKH